MALMEGSFKNMGFIADRGFSNIISPFAEMVEKREWQSRNPRVFTQVSLISLPKTLESRNPNIAISYPTTLTSNLHEVMEEYTKPENQTELGFEATTRQVKERNDDNEDNH